MRTHSYRNSASGELTRLFAVLSYDIFAINVVTVMLGYVYGNGT